MKKSAELSSCGQFRFSLSREWDSTLHTLPFIMLNPSTADAMTDDPTIRKCIGFAERLGYGGIEVFNLFAYRATNPKDLARAGWPVGTGNDSVIAARLRQIRADGHSNVICAWGAHARGLARTGDLLGKLEFGRCRLFALRLLSDGTPAHPLMLPYTCTLVPFSGRPS